MHFQFCFHIQYKKSLHTPVRSAGFCDVKKRKEKELEYKLNHVRSFSIFL